MMCENKTAISKYRHIISVITADYFAHGRRIIRSVQPDYTLLLRFDNGECRRLDMNPVIQAVCSSTWPRGRTSAVSILMPGTAFRGILTRMWTVKPCGTTKSTLTQMDVSWTVHQLHNKKPDSFHSVRLSPYQWLLWNSRCSYRSVSIVRTIISNSASPMTVLRPCAYSSATKSRSVVTSGSVFGMTSSPFRRK